MKKCEYIRRCAIGDYGSSCPDDKEECICYWHQRKFSFRIAMAMIDKKINDLENRIEERDVGLWRKLKK